MNISHSFYLVNWQKEKYPQKRAVDIHLYSMLHMRENFIKTLAWGENVFDQEKTWSTYACNDSATALVESEGKNIYTYMHMQTHTHIHLYMCSYYRKKQK